MLRIAVLDDEDEYIQQIQRITENAMFQLGFDYELRDYTDVEYFLSDLKEEDYFDIYLLDVEMPQMNGLEVARRIRRESMEPIIIYVTNHVDYAVPAYEVNTYRYILKRELEEVLPGAYRFLISKNDPANKRAFLVETSSSVERIPYREIYYFKKDGKYVNIVHKRGESRVRNTLETVQKDLDSEDFLVIDRGYMVNITHVMSLKGQQITLRDGTILPVSRPRYKQVMQAIKEHGRCRTC